MPISFERGKGGSIFHADEGKTATIDRGNTFIQGCGNSDGGFFIIKGDEAIICLNVRRNERTGEPTTITDRFTVNNRTYRFTITAS